MKGSLPSAPKYVANGPGTNNGSSPKTAPPAKGITSNQRSRLLKREEICITFTIPFLRYEDDRTISSLYVLKIYTDHSGGGFTRVSMLTGDQYHQSRPGGPRRMRARYSSNDSPEPSSSTHHVAPAS